MHYSKTGPGPGDRKSRLRLVKTSSAIGDKLVSPDHKSICCKINGLHQMISRVTDSSVILKEKTKTSIYNIL